MTVFLTQPVIIATEKIEFKLRLILNDRQNNILIVVTNNNETERRPLTAYPYHFNDFDKEELQIKEYVLESLENDLIKHTKEDINQLIDYLKEDMETKTKASTNFPENTPKEFYSIFENCQNELRTNSIVNIQDIKENGKPTTPSAIIRELLLTKYKNIIDKINNGETKELLLDCSDLDSIIKGKNRNEYNLLDRLEYSPEKFMDIVKNELKHLIHEKPQSNNPYEIVEDDELYYLRFKNFKETSLKYMLSNKLGRFAQTHGVIKGVYEIQPQLKKGVFECRGCMRLHEVEQILGSDKIIEPSLCSECGGRNFRLREELSNFINQRLISLTEAPEELNLETQPRDLLVMLVGEKEFITKVNAGMKVNITGTLIKAGEKFLLFANNIEKLEDETITVTKDEKQRFLQLSNKDEILDILVDSFAPELIFPREIKEAILLYLVKSAKDTKNLDMIHILIMGDPGTGKSKLKEKVKELSEKCIIASGTGASGIGLTGAVVKDPITNDWVLTAGAIPLASNGHCIIDEIDKMSKEDTTHANNFMESGHDEFNKAGVNGSLIGKTSILALGNPKYERYDPYKSLQDQLNIKPSFQSRFDLIFCIRDIPDVEKDSKIIDSILNEYGQKNKPNTTQNIDSEILLTDELKKYLSFARNEFNPVLTPEAKKCIKKYGLKARSLNTNGEAPYNHRFNRAIIKLAGAYAKLHLRGEITKEDVKKAIHLKEYSIKLIGLDPVTNTIDIDRVTGNLNREDKRQREILKHLIKEYIQDPNNLSEGIPAKTLLEKYQEKTNNRKTNYYDRLKELINAGDIVEFGKGKIKEYKLK